VEGAYAITVSIFTAFSMIHDSGLKESLPADSDCAVSNAFDTYFAGSLADAEEFTNVRNAIILYSASWG
jgi:hypothetical protein